MIRANRRTRIISIMGSLAILLFAAPPPDALDQCIQPVLRYKPFQGSYTYPVM